MRTDERVRIRMPPDRERVWLVYGYHNWIYGSRDDEFTQSKLAPEMKADGFMLGRFGLEWPYLELSGSRDITPFGVDRNQFHYYFIDPETGEALGEERSQFRNSDREAYEFLARNPENPLRFHAYTQGAGGFAERFMGLAVFDRSHPVSSRFLRTRFAEKTCWGNF